MTCHEMRVEDDNVSDDKKIEILSCSIHVGLVVMSRDERQIGRCPKHLKSRNYAIFSSRELVAYVRRRRRKRQYCTSWKALLHPR